MGLKFRFGLGTLTLGDIDNPHTLYNSEKSSDWLTIEGRGYFRDFGGAKGVQDDGVIVALDGLYGNSLS